MRNFSSPKACKKLSVIIYRNLAQEHFLTKANKKKTNKYKSMYSTFLEF